MRKRERWAAPLAAVFALYVASCADPQEVSQIKEKVDVIGAQQKDVLTKLEALVKGQKDIRFMDMKRSFSYRPGEVTDHTGKVVATCKTRFDIKADLFQFALSWKPA